MIFSITQKEIKQMLDISEDVRQAGSLRGTILLKVECKIPNNCIPAIKYSVDDGYSWEDLVTRDCLF